MSFVDAQGSVVARGDKKVGVSDTVRTGSKKVLQAGIESLFNEILTKNNLNEADVELIITSGMITSEIGLLELPHIKAPVGKQALAASIYRCEPEEHLLNIKAPILFVRGVKNNYPDEASPLALRQIDFMRGEEVQCVAIAEKYKDLLPLNFVVLSSHTKIVYMSQDESIQSSLTSISGQAFSAIANHTTVDKSIHTSKENETPSGLTEDEIIHTAADAVQKAGLLRAWLMPRFMDVLMSTTAQERTLFFEASIAGDDLLMFDEMEAIGYRSNNFVLFGHENRCEIYEKLLRQKYGDGIKVVSIYDPDVLADLTVEGNMLVYEKYKQMENENVQI